MDSYQTSQCVLLSVVVGVLLLILGAVCYVLYIFVFAPIFDSIEDEALKAESTMWPPFSITITTEVEEI